MARKINEKLIERMTNGDLVPFLNTIKKEESKLRLEVRLAGKAFVYYKKCKVLDLGLSSNDIDEKYFEDKQKPTDIKNQIISTPDSYFTEILSVVDGWLIKHPKTEFEAQQSIAIANQEKEDKYIILDMEYNFAQNEIEKDGRVKKAGFDLLGIERQTGKIVFFEVKKGLKALSNKSGISSHIIDFEKCLHGIHKVKFRENLIADIKNIVSDKKKLGLINNFDLPEKLSIEDIDLIFVFEPSADGHKDSYAKIYDIEHRKSGSQRKFNTIFVTANNYKLG